MNSPFILMMFGSNLGQLTGSPSSTHYFCYIPFSMQHLRMAIALVLDGRIEEALYTLAVVCSSWSIVNSFTSKRNLLTPLGDIRVASVRCANRMVARTGGNGGLVKGLVDPRNDVFGGCSWGYTSL